MEILQEIVDINSGSDNPAGSHEVFNRLIPIVDGLGFKHQLHEVSSGHHVLSFDMAESQPQRETASAKLDIRYRRSSDLDWLLKKVREIISPPPEPDAMGRQAATSKMSHVVSVSNLPEESSQTLLELAKRIGGRLEMKTGSMHSGYASDANHLSELGIKLLVGLGPYGQGMHTTGETMSIRSYRERVVFNRELLLGILGDEARTLSSSLDPPSD